jgi:hypothetical protein
MKKALELPLSDAFKLSVLNPKTFECPSFDDINKVEIGDFVKVCLTDEDGSNGERFWCQVTKIDKSNLFIYAEINNQLVCWDYKVGTLLKIKYTEVYDIMENKISFNPKNN